MEGFQIEGGSTPYPHIALCAMAPRSICSTPAILGGPFRSVDLLECVLESDVARDRSHGSLRSLPAKPT
jgi:hypothetical protein